MQEQFSIIDKKINELTFYVDNIGAFSDNYLPLSKELEKFTSIPDHEPSPVEDAMLKARCHEASIDNIIIQFKNTLLDLIQQKDNLSFEQLRTIQDLTLSIAGFATKTHRLEEAIDFTHLIASQTLETDAVQIDERSVKVSDLLYGIVDVYKQQYDDLKPKSNAKIKSINHNKQYELEKVVDKLIGEIAAGEFGEELSGCAPGSLYSLLENKFFPKSLRNPAAYDEMAIW